MLSFYYISNLCQILTLSQNNNLGCTRCVREMIFLFLLHRYAKPFKVNQEMFMFTQFLHRLSFSLSARHT